MTNNTRPHISTVSAEVRQAEEARVAASRDQDSADDRGAAALNYLETCRDQSRRSVFTNADFKALRILLGTGDEVVRLDQDDARVPAGFGPAVRALQSGKLDAVAEALQSKTTINEPDGSSEPDA